MLEMMVAVLDEGPEKGFAPIVRAYSGKKTYIYIYILVTQSDMFFLFCNSVKWP